MKELEKIWDKKENAKFLNFSVKKSNENKTDNCEFEEWNDGVDEESLVRQSCLGTYRATVAKFSLEIAKYSKRIPIYNNFQRMQFLFHGL